jgi:DNA-binding MarR family transcriptional regulator
MAELKTRADVAFFALVGVVERLASQRLERVLEGGLSLPGFGVLNQLALAPAPPTPLDLAEALQVPKTTMTHTLHRLEAAGLVAVSADSRDGRSKRIALTAAGEAALRAALVALRPRLEEVRAAFETAEFAAALPFLERMRAWLAAHP